MFFFAAENEKQALEALAVLEYYRQQVEQYTGNKIQHVPVVIEDIGAISNGYANPVYFNIHLFNYNPELGELEYTPNWWALVGVHEYTHMLQMSKAEGFPNVLCFFFGHALSPNLLTPAWFYEGIAVLEESQLSPHQGRLNHSYYNQFIEQAIEDENFYSIVNATFIPDQFPGVTAMYIYGAKFIEYLANKYGKEKLKSFIAYYAKTVGAYFSPVFPAMGLDLSANIIYGKPFAELWQEWESTEKQKQGTDKSVKEQITDNRWYIGDICYVDNMLYYTRQFQVKPEPFNNDYLSEIVELDLSKQPYQTRAITSTTSWYGQNIDIKDDYLYYLEAQIKPGYDNIFYLGYGYYYVLWQQSLKNGQQKALLHKDIRAFAVLPGQTIIFSQDKKQGFGSDIFLYDFIDDTLEHILSSDYLVNEIVADKQNIYLSARLNNQNFSIYQLDLINKHISPLIETPFMESRLFIQDGNLFFTANYNKIQQIYKYDTITGGLYVLDNIDYTESFVPVKQENRVYFVGMTSKAKEIYRSQAQFNQISIPRYPRAEIPDYTMETEQIKQGSYFDNLGTLSPKVIYPYFNLDTADSETMIRTGGGVMGQSAIGDIWYDGLAYYDFYNDVPEYSFSLSTILFPPLSSTFSFSKIGVYYCSATLSYTLYKNISPGLSHIRIGLTDSLFGDNFEHHEISPFLLFGFGCGLLRWNWGAWVALEREELGSRFDNFSVIGNTSLEILLLEGELGINTTVSYNPYDAIEYFGSTLPTIYTNTYINYSHMLFPLRGGCWNPSLYFGDLFLNLFFNYAIDNNFEDSYFFGLELIQETKAFSVSTGLPVKISLALSFNELWEPIFQINVIPDMSIFGIEQNPINCKERLKK